MATKSFSDPLIGAKAGKENSSCDSLDLNKNHRNDKIKDYKKEKSDSAVKKWKSSDDVVHTNKNEVLKYNKNMFDEKPSCQTISKIEESETIANSYCNISHSSKLFSKPVLKLSNSLTLERLQKDKSYTEVMNKFKTLLINPHKIESATTITITNDNFENAKKCGNDYFNSGNYLASAVWYTRILNSPLVDFEKKAIIYSNRSAAYLCIKSDDAVENAMLDAVMCIQQLPKWWKGYYRMASAHIELGDYFAAARFLKAALKLNPDSTLLQIELIEVEKKKLKIQIPEKVITAAALNLKKDGKFESKVLSLMKLNNKIHNEELDDYDVFDSKTKSSASVSQSSESLIETARNGGDMDYVFNNSYGSDNTSLKSIANNDDNGHEVIDLSDSDQPFVANGDEVIDLQDSDESFIDEKRESVRALNSKELLLIALNIDKSFDKNRVPVPPTIIPHKKGNYLYIMDSKFKPVNDITNADQLHPWNSEKLKVRSKQYFNKYEINNNTVIKYQRVPAKERELFNNYSFEYQISHHTLPVSKKIIAVVKPSDRIPVENSRIVFYYSVSEDSEEIKNECEQLKNPRMPASTVAEVKSLLKTKTPGQAARAYEASSTLMGDFHPVSDAQVNNLARHMVRDPPTNIGRKKATDFGEITKMMDDGDFVLEFSQSKDNLNYFMGFKCALSLLEASLVKPTTINKLSNDIEKCLQSAGSERFGKLSKIVSSNDFKNSQKTSCCAIDTTFNVCSLHLTIVLFSSPHFVRKDGSPVWIIGCLMLSSKKDAAAYEWMASAMNRHINSGGLVFRMLMTDSDTALDAFHKADVFDSPCQRAHCKIHIVENIKTKIDVQQHEFKILEDIFGPIIEGKKYKGLFDELTFHEFENKLQKLCESETWKQNPRLLEWFKKPSRRERLFKRCGLLSRVRGGWGFENPSTNIIESENMHVKADIPDNTPINKCIRLLKKYCNDTLVRVGKSLIQQEPVALKDQRLFVGMYKWKSFTVEEKTKALKSINMVETSKIEGFQLLPPSFPPCLAPNMSEEERDNLMADAQKMEVLPSKNVPGIYVVLGNKSTKVSVKNNVVGCECKPTDRRAVICVHILAVHHQFPELRLLQLLETFLQNESIAERMDRTTANNAGAKPGTTRKTQRRAPTATRNIRKRPIDQVYDLEPANSNTSNEVLAVVAASATSSAPTTSYHIHQRTDTRPVAVAARKNFHNPVVQAALHSYMEAFNIQAKPIWYNSNTFFIKSPAKVTDAFKRKCAQCGLSIKKGDDIVVMTHLEHYEYYIEGALQANKGWGERIIHATYDCFILRYPYVNVACIASEVTPLEKVNTLQKFFPQ